MRRTTQRPLYLSLVACALSVAVSACGGGGAHSSGRTTKAQLDAKLEAYIALHHPPVSANAFAGAFGSKTAADFLGAQGWETIDGVSGQFAGGTVTYASKGTRATLSAPGTEEFVPHVRHSLPVRQRLLAQNGTPTPATVRVTATFQRSQGVWRVQEIVATEIHRGSGPMPSKLITDRVRAVIHKLFKFNRGQSAAVSKSERAYDAAQRRFYSTEDGNAGPPRIVARNNATVAGVATGPGGSTIGSFYLGNLFHGVLRHCATGPSSTITQVGLPQILRATHVTLAAPRLLFRVPVTVGVTGQATLTGVGWQGEASSGSATAQCGKAGRRITFAAVMVQSSYRPASWLVGELQIVGKGALYGGILSPAFDWTGAA